MEIYIKVIDKLEKLLFKINSVKFNFSIVVLKYDTLVFTCVNF